MPYVPDHRYPAGGGGSAYTIPPSSITNTVPSESTLGLIVIVPA
jgi:hypothetical protein